MIVIEDYEEMSLVVSYYVLGYIMVLWWVNLVVMVGSMLKWMYKYLIVVVKGKVFYDWVYYYNFDEIFFCGQL